MTFNINNEVIITIPTSITIQYIVHRKTENSMNVEWMLIAHPFEKNRVMLHVTYYIQYSVMFNVDTVYILHLTLIVHRYINFVRWVEVLPFSQPRKTYGMQLSDIERGKH